MTPEQIEAISGLQMALEAREEQMRSDAASRQYAYLDPEERYRRDTEFHQLVDHMEYFIKKANFTPTEMREAVVLACIHYESARVDPVLLFKGDWRMKYNLPTDIAGRLARRDNLAYLVSDRGSFLLLVDPSRLPNDLMGLLCSASIVDEADAEAKKMVETFAAAKASHPDLNFIGMCKNLNGVV